MKLKLLLAALVLTPTMAQAAPEYSAEDKVTHVLNRLTFGARPGDEEKVRSLGVQKFIDAQLQPNSIPESPEVLAQTKKVSNSLNAPSSQLLAMLRSEMVKRKALKKAEADADVKSNPTMTDEQQPDVQAKKLKRAALGPNAKKLTGQDAIETKLVRAVESPRQLNELMADFWFNHFNICMTKGADRILVGAYEEQAIRPFAFSKFRDLLGATMHHPAMMFYLDNAQNTKDGFQPLNPKAKNKGINENYARELLELHTLGVDGGYTQKDVTELARVLTGWTMPVQRRNAGDQYWAYFDARRHDYGEKVILGHTIKGTGGDEIEKVLDMLAAHPSTAHYISYQLAQYFVDDNPPPALVDKLAQRFTATQGDTRAVLKTLFASQEFWDPKYQNNKFKSPFHYTVSAMRATGMHADQPLALQAFLKTQGQPLYGCLTPDGYKNTKDAWLNPDGLLKRMDFATKLAAAQVRQSNTDAASIAKTVNGGKLSPKTQKAIEGISEQQKVAALLGSPEFMHY